MMFFLGLGVMADFLRESNISVRSLITTLETAFLYCLLFSGYLSSFTQTSHTVGTLGKIVDGRDFTCPFEISIRNSVIDPNLFVFGNIPKFLLHTEFII